MPTTAAISNADVVRKAFAAFNAGDAATLNELIAEDAVWHNPGQGPLCGVHEGREAIFAVFGQVAELCPNYQAQLVDLLANDERVVAIARATAIALLPLRKPLTEATAYFGGMAMHLGT